MAMWAFPPVLPAQQPDEAPANYVVHEWGTFTSMVGTAGIALDGLHHEEEALPPFVHDLQKVKEFGVEIVKLPASRVTQKMETPVLYFYADAALQAQVQVFFSRGLMTQFYPLPSTVMPRLDEALQQRVDMSTVNLSSLTWDIDIVPRTAAAPAEIPVVAADQPWSFARQTAACWVRTRPAADSPAKPEAEHYLFYRGLGRWQPDVALQCGAGGAVTFTNRMGQDVPFCLALELGEHGGRWAAGKSLATGASCTFALGEAPWQADREQFARQVGAAVEHALVARGLFVDEARAMVATWSRSWFQKDGARVVYLLPREQVDAVLPLNLTPRPKDLVRVLVGRLEFITPEAQSCVEQALRDRAVTDPAVTARGAAVLAGLDRFLEPHLRNIAANGSTREVRAAAEVLLAEPQRAEPQRANPLR